MKIVKQYVVYLLGIVILSFGLALNVKSYLGVAPILTMPLAVSTILDWNFPFTVLLFYILFIILQVPLKGKKFRAMDLLQLPISFVISKLLDIFTGIIPVTESDPIFIRAIVLTLAIIVTGIGVAMSVAMNKAPNPADGLTHAFSGRFNIGLGTSKNIIDLTSIGVSFILAMYYLRKTVGIGIGTVAAGLFVGRVIAIFNKMFKKQLDEIAGTAEKQSA